MKTNNSKKIVVSVLALAMGAGVAGSISGSMAWYQYSTRAYAAINGTTVGTLGRLQLKQSTEADTAYADVKTIAAKDFKPSSVKVNNRVLTFLDHPVYQVPTLPTADLSDDDNLPYVDYKFNFRFQENTTNSDEGWTTKPTARNIYLSHFGVIDSGTAEGHKDVSGAVRAAFYVGDVTGESAAKAILSKSATAQTTTTHGNLNLNNNNNVDTMKFDLSDDDYATNAIDYTNGAQSYTTDAHATWIPTAQELANIYDLDDNIGDKALCTTAETLTVRVWLEGWELLNSSASWTKEYINQNFELQLQFVCQADR